MRPGQDGDVQLHEGEYWDVSLWVVVGVSAVAVATVMAQRV